MCTCLQEEKGRVLIDFSCCSSRSLSETYQQFGILCARGNVRAALLKTGDEQAEAHYALRDVLVTIARIAGIPLRFKLALVTASDSSGKAHLYRCIRDDLRALGCEAKVFRAEGEAKRWLGSDRRAAQSSQAIGTPAVV